MPLPDAPVGHARAHDQPRLCAINGCVSSALLVQALFLLLKRLISEHLKQWTWHGSASDKSISSRHGYKLGRVLSWRLCYKQSKAATVAESNGRGGSLGQKTQRNKLIYSPHAEA